MAADLAALRNYVMAPGGQNQSDSTCLLSVSHSNLSAVFMELRFDLHMTVRSMKEKLNRHCGTAVGSMVLKLKDERGAEIGVLAEDHRPLGYYSPQPGYRLHIVDTDPNSCSANGWLEDVSKVEKYEISEEAYNARETTYRKFKADKLAQDPSWSLKKEMALKRGEEWVQKEQITDEEHLAEEAKAIAVGNRCEVTPGGKRAEVKYVGKVAGLPLGWWVGVQYDEPVGKNDGSVKGVRVFECPTGYGGFVRPNNVTVGDFPEEDLFASDEDEI